MSSLAGTDSIFASKDSGVTGVVTETEVNISDEIFKVSSTLLNLQPFLTEEL